MPVREIPLVAGQCAEFAESLWTPCSGLEACRNDCDQASTSRALVRVVVREKLRSDALLGRVSLPRSLISWRAQVLSLAFSS